MKNSQRVMVYLIGFILGSLLVSMILSRRASKGEAVVDPWAIHNMEAVAGGAEPLPDHMPASIHKGRIIGFGYLPDEEKAEERVWLLNFDKTIPTFVSLRRSRRESPALWQRIRSRFI